MADKGAVRSSKLRNLPAMAAWLSLRPGRFELKAWKWVLRWLTVEFSL